MTSEGGESSKPPVEGNARQAPTTLTGQHRALDEAAAQLVAAWDVDLASRTPSEGLEALERLRTPTPVSSFPPAPKTPTLPAIPSYPTTRKSSGSGKWIAAAAALLLVAAGVWLGGRRGDVPSVTEDPDTAAAVESESGPGVGTSPSPAPAAVGKPVVEEIASEYQLTVRTIPRDASLQIDGERVRNPYRGRHAHDDRLRIVADAAGHAQAVREIELGEDTHLMVTLEPEEKAEAAPPPAAVRRQKARRKKKARARRAKQRRKQARSRGDERSRGSKGSGFVSSNPYQ